MKIIFIVGTRLSEEEFVTNSTLAKSLKLFDSNHIEIELYGNNESGLPIIYNHALTHIKASPDDILIFCHDDIGILDFYWMDHLISGLTRFDVVGLAGNRKRIKMQPSWLFNDLTFSTFDAASLSGIVAHGKNLIAEKLSVYGAPDQEVELLDGLFLATTMKTVSENKLCFDERFNFDFYDLDFCRLARRKGLKLGTVPLSVVHESEGNFNTESWRSAYTKYIEKWKD
jgi:GT2 family glycosyltransferase